APRVPACRAVLPTAVAPSTAGSAASHCWSAFRATRSAPSSSRHTPARQRAASAEATGHVVAGARIDWPGEHLLGVAKLDEHAGTPTVAGVEREERGAVRDAGCLLHVVG